ncbi:VOC family protein [Streptosporangium canum]|uniref:VOC family protein n=1 Tax=Streptosporangium canum TaxID=324952 RepID=UPI0037BC2199
MSLPVSAIMLSVKDLARAKKFYAEDLGCKIDKDTRNFVSFSFGEGSPRLALHEWEAAAQDAGVSAEGSGFRGASFHFNPDSRGVVDEMTRNAVAAGGSVVKEAPPPSGAGTSATSATRTAICGKSPPTPPDP